MSVYHLAQNKRETSKALDTFTEVGNRSYCKFKDTRAGPDVVLYDYTHLTVTYTGKMDMESLFVRPGAKSPHRVKTHTITTKIYRCSRKTSSK